MEEKKDLEDMNVVIIIIFLAVLGLSCCSGFSVVAAS